MEYRPISTDDSSLAAYAALFAACFPGASHLNETYLRWLYRSNPDGEVVGFDAFEGDRLAGHYACIPVALEVFGKPVRGLLSLNTATHPDFQGRGLFTALASRTYELGAERGFEAVYGIANANSTPGFIRKLGFSLISPLDARVSIGRPATVDWQRIGQRTEFRRTWSGDSLRWRCTNPQNTIHVVRKAGDSLELRAATDKPLISVWASVAAMPDAPALTSLPGRPLSLFIGLLPEDTYRYGWSASIPDRLRPSPLNFIYRPLATGARTPAGGAIQCSFVDFDAY